MQIHIQARGLELTEGLREHVRRRLRFALGWADDHLRQVSVRLSDESGPHGGKEKHCQIQIEIPGTSDLTIEDIEVDVYVAIDRAADRAGRAVSHRLERLRDHRQSLPSRVESDDATTHF